MGPRIQQTCLSPASEGGACTIPSNFFPFPVYFSNFPQQIRIFNPYPDVCHLMYRLIIQLIGLFAIKCFFNIPPLSKLIPLIVCSFLKYIFLIRAGWYVVEDLSSYVPKVFRIGTINLRKSLLGTTQEVSSRKYWYFDEAGHGWQNCHSPTSDGHGKRQH